MNEEILKSNIKYLRNMSGMSQQELSKKLGYGEDSNPVKDWERDRVIPENMIKEIANIFEIPITTLIGENLETYTDVFADLLDEDDDWLKNYFHIRQAKSRKKMIILKKLI